MKKIYTILAIIIILAIIGSLYFADVEYNYNVKKCKNMNSSSSNYDFTNRIELNAQYNENCYFLFNHPLAKASYYIVAILVVVMISLFLIFIVNLITDLHSI